MKYQEENFKDVVKELKPMLVKHWEELANNKEVRPLDVDYNKYIELNEHGCFRLFTVRNDEDKLVGYASFFINFNLHYQTWLFASVDVYYIDPDYRNAGVGSQFITEMESWLKSMKVRSVTMMDKLHKSHESFFVKLGYKPVEQLYEKVL